MLKGVELFVVFSIRCKFRILAILSVSWGCLCDTLTPLQTSFYVHSTLYSIECTFWNSLGYPRIPRCTMKNLNNPPKRRDQGALKADILLLAKMWPICCHKRIVCCVSRSMKKKRKKIVPLHSNNPYILVQPNVIIGERMCLLSVARTTDYITELSLTHWLIYAVKLNKNVLWSTMQ